MTNGASPSDTGSWSTADAPLFAQIPIHTAVLPTGKVLGFGGSGNDEHRFRERPHPFEVWDPEKNEIETYLRSLAGDIFCAGHAFLPDGRLLVAGGTAAYDWVPGGITLKAFGGLNHTYAFDPTTETWTRLQNMRKGRWYPTLIALGDGRVLAVAGLTRWIPWFLLRRIEIYESGKWRKAKGASRWMPLYPHLHLLPDGSVFYTGTYNTHYPRHFRLKGFPASRLVEEKVGSRTRFRWHPAKPGEFFQRQEGASVLLPLRPQDYTPRILIIGGADMGSELPLRECKIVEIHGDSQHWHSTSSMNHARYFVYVSILPDGNVLALGGRTGNKGHGETGMPHLEPELFDPRNESWRPAASMTLGREYHSSSLLLPDGRVLALGGNIGDKRREEQLQSEVYSPPYLHKGERPEIKDPTLGITAGEKFDIVTPDAEKITEVVLIRPASTTHCLTTDQRFVELPIHGRESDKIVAELPVVLDKPYLAPPGHYMLFLLASGIPSKAKFVRVGEQST